LNELLHSDYGVIYTLGIDKDRGESFDGQQENMS